MDGTTKNAVKGGKALLRRAALFLPAAPALIFIAGMAVALFHSVFSYSRYFIDIVPVTRWAVVTGVLAIAVRLSGRGPGGGMKQAVLSNPTVLFFSAMIVLMLFSTLRNGFTPQVLYGDEYRCESLFSFIIYPAIYYFASSLIGSERARRALLDGFLGVSAVIAIAALLQLAAAKFGTVFFGLPFFRTELYSPGVVGIYHQFNHYGYTLTLAIALSGALFVCTKKAVLRVLYLALFVLFTAVLILNDTFGCYLASFAALLLLIGICFARDKKLRFSTVFLLAVFLIVSNVVVPGRVWQNVSQFFLDILHAFGFLRGTVPSSVADLAGTHRWKLWKATFPMILERPLLGYGVEGIAPLLEAKTGLDRPHNEFLQYAAFFGIPALLCYLGALASVWSHFRKRLHTASPCTIAAFTAAFGYVVSSCFGNTMYYTAPLFFILLGLADAYPSAKDD